jgi:hypothetical protein
MKNKLFLSGIAGLILLTGIVLTGCKQEPEPAKKYTVTFAKGGAGGQAPQAQEVEEGKKIRLPGKGELTREGYTFDGWNTRSLLRL